MDIVDLLEKVPDLSPERRAQLAADFEADTLSQEDKLTLQGYMVALVARLETEVEAAKEFLPS